MTAELAPYQAQPVAVASAPESLVAWARAASAAAQLVGPIITTDFCPAHFKGNVAAATAAVIFGAEIGLSPMQSLQGIYVVSGRPGLYAKSMVAVTLGHGHSVWTEKLTDTEAVVCGQRRGSEHVERVSFTLARAQKAGYTKNAKYGSDPQSMLYARASSEVCRRIAADALLGLAYSVEELEDENPTTVTMQRDADAPKRTARRATLARVETPEPEFDVPADSLDEFHPDTTSNPQENVEPVTAPQVAAINAALTSRGIKDREEKLAFLGRLIGREVKSSKDLSKREASQVLDELSDDTPAATPDAPAADLWAGEQS